MATLHPHTKKDLIRRGVNPDELSDSVIAQIVRRKELSNAAGELMIQFVCSGFQMPFFRAKRIYKVAGRGKREDIRARLVYGKGSPEHLVALDKESSRTWTSVGYWTAKGMTEEEARSHLSGLQSRSQEYYTSKGLSASEAAEKVASNTKAVVHASRNQSTEIRKLKGVTLENMQRKYGVEEGARRYSDARSRMGWSLKALQDKHGELQGLILYEEHRQSFAKRMPTRIEYWLEQGLNTEEAEAKRSEYSKGWNRFGIAYCVKKYGVSEGRKVFEKRQKAWIKTLNENNDPNELTRKKTSWLKERGHVVQAPCSKESTLFFAPILDILKEAGVQYYFGEPGNKEWFIHSERGWRFFDLTVPSLNLIVEFHGEKFHADPRVPADKRDSWKSLFQGKSWEECREADEFKKSLATQAGFQYHEVWSYEPERIWDIIEIVESALRDMQ